ncbi:MAG: hypothetical protein QM611_03040 [Microbacterium sp.]|uniref:hypothetical protein n=1 Tax=Microbacterium sp. TaxID=51671 RepID=UPI0039E301AF
MSTISELTAALAGCTGTAAAPTAIALGGNITAASTTVTVGCVTELDLAGATLQVRNVVVSSGQQLTIRDTGSGGQLTATSSASAVPGIKTAGAKLIIDSGAVTASGGTAAAGIGSNNSDADSGEIIINGGTVTATGGAAIGGAGIGGVLPTITINDGVVTASGGGGSLNGAAGIGGNYLQGGGGLITINGGTVIANGSGGSGRGGAGIGGGFNNASGGTATQGMASDVVITGGTVTATGGNGAAGIGGGRGGGLGSVTITGGTVSAIAAAGEAAAGIGGGYVANYSATRPEFGSGGEVYIGEAADVTAIGAHTAVGSGGISTSFSHPDVVEFGSLTVDGTLRVPSGAMRVQDSISDGSEIVVGESGEILGAASDPTAGATFSGTTFSADIGQIENNGVIALTEAYLTAGGVSVYANHYEVDFDVHGGTPEPPADAIIVFAPSFDVSYRTFPYADDPTRDAALFKGWNSAEDGSGSVLSEDAQLPGTSLDGVAVPVTFHALWATDPEIISGLPGDEISITTTTSGSFTPTIEDADGSSYPFDPADWSITDADGMVTPSIDTVTGEVTVTSSTAGTYVLTLSISTVAGVITRDIEVHVALTSFTASPTASFTGTLKVGQTLTASAGTTTEPTPDSVEFTWFADGVEVGTGPTYVLTSADAGTYISVRATAKLQGYADASDLSAALGPVAAADPDPEPTSSPSADPSPDPTSDPSTSPTSDSSTSPTSDPDDSGLASSGGEAPVWIAALLAPALLAGGALALVVARRSSRSRGQLP